MSSNTPVAPVNEHKWWVWSPAYTLGMVAFVPAVHAAVKFRTRATVIPAVALVLLDVIVWALLGGDSTPAGEPSESTVADSVGVILTLTLAVAGTAYAFSVRDKVFAPSIPEPLSPAHNPAVAQVLQARETRKAARELAERDPAMARELKIGRVDLPAPQRSSYNDGGLVDINAVGADLLVAHLSISAADAHAIVTARETLGRFQSVDDLMLINTLSGPLLDEVRERLVAL